MRDRLTKSVGAFLALFIANNNRKLAVFWAIDLLLIIFGLAVVGMGGEVERMALDGLPASFRNIMTAYDPSLAPSYGARLQAWIDSWVWLPSYWQFVGLWTLWCVIYIPIAFSDEFSLLTKSITGAVSRRRRSGSQGSGPSQGGTTPATPSHEPAELLKGKGPWVAFIVTLGAFIFDEIRDRWMAKRAHRLAKKIAGE